ncbi:glycerate kinase [Subtercola boreus]|uniref:Glycerate kinase n=1 Tax=Subtercola boreus TaxID=120213 RepID=A0A3E0WDH2_9MICO|nr:glycerate kinase [Subtercola boreus]RFA22495.1 hypothetical protein B7R24_02380 [Subtercola boreus]RFA23265.1 hypothetical protein B7R23_02370 [Subtercola boreus]RFA29073.1 hypothetical protein B7R25_02385 [Subtercola boreus]
MSPSLTVVVAPDSFKGSASAAEAAAAIGGGWSEARPGDTVLLRPMADGGEGTLDAFALAVPGAVRMPITITGPIGEPVEAEWLWLPPGAGAGAGAARGGGAPGAEGGIGVVELARTSGVTLLRHLRPMDAQTTGFGEAIAAALDHGVERLVLAIGGSASTDGGTGALTALGARFLDADGVPVPPSGAGLSAIAGADLGALRSLPAGGAEVVTDVTSPLLGPEGAAAVFGPQKGADARQVSTLERGLASLLRVVNEELRPPEPREFRGLDSRGAVGPLDPQTPGRLDPRGAADRLDPWAPGAGAAGGTGWGLAVWGARILNGAAVVSETIGLARDIAGADVVITGEGRFDAQSAAGKVPAHVAALAERHGTFALLVAGSIDADADAAAFAASVSLSELAGSSAAAIENPLPFLWAAGRALATGAAKTPEG